MSDRFTSGASEVDIGDAVGIVDVEEGIVRALWGDVDLKKEGDVSEGCKSTRVNGGEDGE